MTPKDWHYWKSSQEKERTRIKLSYYVCKKCRSHNTFHSDWVRLKRGGWRERFRYDWYEQFRCEKCGYKFVLTYRKSFTLGGQKGQIY